MQGYKKQSINLINLEPASHKAFEQTGGGKCRLPFSSNAQCMAKEGAKTCPYVNQSAPFSVQSFVPSPRGRVPERQEGVQQCINRTTTRPRMSLRSNDGDLLLKEVGISAPFKGEVARSAKGGFSKQPERGCVC